MNEHVYDKNDMIRLWYDMSYVQAYVLSWG